MFFVLFGLLFSLFIYFIFDVIEIFKDIFLQRPKNLVGRVYRIQPIWNRYNKNKRIGFYETYVLNREMNLFIKVGGDPAYFTNGSGSCCVM